MFFEFVSPAIELLIQTIGALGYVGVFILMALESSIFPVPSEAVLIPAGVLVARGEQSLLVLFLVSTFGSIVGSLACYYIARTWGRRVVGHFVRRYGMFFFLSEESLLKTEQYFASHGEITIFVGRLLPVIRHLISLPAGFANMYVASFILYTTLGAGIWNLILIYLGVLFGNNTDLIRENLGSLTLWTLLFVGILVLAYVFWHRIKNRRSVS